MTIRQVFNATRVAQLPKVGGQVGSWPESEDKWLHHFEATERTTPRTEGFVPTTGTRPRVDGRHPEIVGMAMGEPVFLFRKINYVPGGAGYAARRTHRVSHAAAGGD